MARGPFWTPEEIGWFTEHPTAGYAEFLDAGFRRPQTSFNTKRAELLRAGVVVDRRGPAAFTFQEAADLAAGRMHRQADRNLDLVPPGVPDDPLPEGDALDQLLDAAEGFSSALDVYEGHIVRQHTIDHCVSGPIGIAFVGDIHYGGRIKYATLRRDVEVIAQTDGLYAVLMGDQMDNYKPQAKSGTALYGGAFNNPNLQCSGLVRRLRPAKGKWLALLQGNHDAWDGKYAGIDRLPDLADDLGCLYVTEGGASLFVDAADDDSGVVHRYHIIVKHDYLGKSANNPSNSARRLWEDWPWSFENADAVCLAHTHEPNLQHTERKGQLIHYLRTGTYKINDDWAIAKGYRPAYGVPLLVLFPDEHKIVAFAGPQFLDGVDYLNLKRQQWKRQRDEAA